MKNFLLILVLLVFTLPVIAESGNSGIYIGPPPGFYDDIDPNSIDDEESSQYNNSTSKEKERTEVKQEPAINTESYKNLANTKPSKDFTQIYNQLEPASFSYMHGIDPDEYYDSQNAAWSIYPLLRLNSAIYFKKQTIEPGYYLLTPREHKGKWYILFKQNGKVIHIIPVYERGITPVHYYEEHIPKPKLTRSQKLHLKGLNVLGNRKHSKRQQPVKSFLEIDDLDNYFIDIKIYYGEHRYNTLFRSIRL